MGGLGQLMRKNIQAAASPRLNHSHHYYQKTRTHRTSACVTACVTCRPCCPSPAHAGVRVDAESNQLQMRASSNDFQAQYFGIQSGGSRTSQSANLIYIYIYISKRCRRLTWSRPLASTMRRRGETSAPSASLHPYSSKWYCCHLAR